MLGHETPFFSSGEQPPAHEESQPLAGRVPSTEIDPDARLAVFNNAGDLSARCSLWWQNTPRHSGRTVGYIGHYQANDSQSAASLLASACRRLATNGCMLAVGPVDGSTWMSYRHVVETSGAPPFFMEPRNPPDFPVQLDAAGFTALAHYRSSVQENLSARSERIDRAHDRLHGMGVEIRSLDAHRIDRELHAIHALSLECFEDALLFSPIDFESFKARYRPLLPHIDPELVLLAEHRSRLVGYLFGLPDALQTTRGDAVDTVIVKTIAVSPRRRYAGLGHVLTMIAAARARELGYRRAIHALMHERTGSANWSARFGHPIRRYALFYKALDSSL